MQVCCQRARQFFFLGASCHEHAEPRNGLRARAGHGWQRCQILPHQRHVNGTPRLLFAAKELPLILELLLRCSPRCSFTCAERPSLHCSVRVISPMSSFCKYLFFTRLPPVLTVSASRRSLSYYSSDIMLLSELSWEHRRRRSFWVSFSVDVPKFIHAANFRGDVYDRCVIDRVFFLPCHRLLRLHRVFRPMRAAPSMTSREQRRSSNERIEAATKLAGRQSP